MEIDRIHSKLISINTQQSGRGGAGECDNNKGGGGGGGGGGTRWRKESLPTRCPSTSPIFGRNELLPLPLLFEGAAYDALHIAHIGDAEKLPSIR